MGFFDISFLQGFAGNLFATLIGVIAGILAAFYLDRWVENKTEKEKKKRVLRMLMFELNNNHKLLTEWMQNKNTSPSKRMYGAFLNDETWNALSDGGEIQWIKDVGILGFLADAYGEIKRIKYLYDSYLHWQSLAGQPEAIINQDLWVSIEDAIAYIVVARDLINNNLPNS